MKAFTVHDVLEIARFTDTPCITPLYTCLITAAPADSLSGGVSQQLCPGGLRPMLRFTYVVSQGHQYLFQEYLGEGKVATLSACLLREYKLPVRYTSLYWSSLL